MRTVDTAERTREVSGLKGYWVSLVVAVIGLGLALELTSIHVALLRDPFHESFCNVSSTVNCDAVATSRYSELFQIPLSIWGAFAYAAAAFFAIWGIATKRAAPSVLLLAIGGISTVSAFGLAFISAFRLHTLCLLCMASWAVDFALLACAIVAVKAYQWSVAWRELSRFGRENGIRCGLFVVLGALAFVATVRALPTKRALVSSTSSGLAVSSAIHSASAPPANTGVDPAGHPYTGATQPSLTIVEFSDYQCPHCAKAHGTLRALVQRYPNEIRVVHRHFPLDNDCNPLITRPFHQHSCYYSRLAVCSATFGRFWLANDYLFEHGRDEAPVALETLARIIDVKPEDLRRCLSEKGDALLKPDIDEGLQLHIDGTPTFVIDGQLYTGRLPPNVLEKYPL